MSIRNRIRDLLSKLDQENRDLILYFLIESQTMEYGIIYLLSQHPFLTELKLEDISNKPLGFLINELEKTGMTILAGKIKEFNKLRVVIVHNLIYLEMPINELIDDISKKIKLAQKIQQDIDDEFNDVYINLLDIPYGSIFE